MKKKYLIICCRMLVLFLVAGLYSCQCNTKGKMDLEPPDKRQVYHTIVGDAHEAEILKQELQIELQNVMLPDLWFYTKDESTLNKMKDLGYEISKSELKQVHSKVVK